MSEILKKWLKHHLDGLVSVQTTTIGGAADLVVHTWSGVKINVHFIDQPVRPRALKRTLQDTTHTGIGTMFILSAGLLPQDGQRVSIPEWLLAFHALTNERIYIYGVRDNQPEISQVHFEPVNNGSGDYKTWYGPAVKFNQLRFYRASVRYRPIKGDWIVADFGSHAFWKNTDYRHYRTRKDTEYARRQTTWQTWSGYQQTWSGNNEAAPSKSPLQEHLEACYTILGIEITANRDEVRAAFRKQAIIYHPDTSQLPPEEAEEKFRALNAAYDYIKSANGWT